MQKITPFLWFDGRVEEAVKFYTSIFKNSKVENVSPMHARFQIEGQELIAFNGGPDHPFSEAISLYVDCKTQQEVDDLWERLSAGGKKSRCGWLQDKFGLWWQIIPSALPEFLGDEDDEKSDRVLQAMLKMDKIDIEGLKSAYRGGTAATR